MLVRRFVDRWQHNAVLRNVDNKMCFFLYIYNLKKKNLLLYLL